MQNTIFMPRRPNDIYNILILFSEDFSDKSLIIWIKVWHFKIILMYVESLNHENSNLLVYKDHNIGKVIIFGT